MSMMFDRDVTTAAPENKPVEKKLHTDIQRILIRERMKNHNRDYLHPSYLIELRLVQAISEGAAAEALDLLDKINGLERAELSADPIRSLKNSLIGSCTIFARAAIQGGVDSESAFMLSDLFIRQIEQVFAKPQAESLEYDMLLAFVQSVNDSRLNREEEIYSPVLVRTRAYIRENIHRSLSLSEVAEVVNIHPNYLSTLFTKECNQTFMSYVDEERIKQIKKFLIYTELPMSRLAINFEFRSFSQFSTYFKKHTGCSPREYRKLHGEAHTHRETTI